MKTNSALKVLGLTLVTLLLWVLTKPQPGSRPPGYTATPAASVPSASTPSPAIVASLPNTSGNLPPRPPAPVPEVAAPGGGTTPAVPLSAAPVAPAPATESLPSGDSLKELDAVQDVLRVYRSAMGGNPVGTNAEITRALLGDNLKQVRQSLPAGSSLNGEGEMLDPFGTPYFFHQLSGTQMEIRSAGPDRKLWTDDDLVRK